MPFGTGIVNVEVVDDPLWPSTVTFHRTPAVSPLSVNLTGYVNGVHVRSTVTGLP